MIGTPICWAILTTTKPITTTTRSLLSGSLSPSFIRPTCSFFSCDQPPIVISQFSASSKTTSLLRLHASSSPSNNKTKPPPLPTTDDPFILLGLDPTADSKAIKSAYRKRAMKYHPDVILNTDSSPKERDVASKDFARINAAYEMLTGGDKVKNGASGGATTSSSGGDYTYQPPHRRQSGYSSSTTSPNNGGKSINWEDFMPKYDEEDAKYDSGGDSFGSIFSDLLSGAAGYAAGAVAGGGGGGGVMGDLIDFLERNVGGFESGSYDDDTSLSQLLSYGTFDEVASEMDEADILVSSLETKSNTIENQLIQAQADLTGATKFSEKLDIEEGIAELKAREKVVKGYLKKGKKRLIRLRERYKELIVDGRGGKGYGDTNARDNTSSATSSSSRTSSRSEPAQPPPSSSASSTFSTPSSAPASASAPVSSSTNNSWRNEGFRGSYGRTSSSSSRRSSRRSPVGTSTNEASSDPAPTTVDRQSNQQKSSRQNESGNSGGGTIVPQQYEPWVPPHRRTQSTAERDTQVKKRLRELKVDDDFDKLKREMGM